MSRDPSFAVLMAAFNGMEWIEEQVDSILMQKGVAVTLYISIDTSSDGTFEWCKARADIDPRVVVLPDVGRFGGAAKNFFRLIRDVDFSTFDYISLSDQDDIWIEDKLLAAHESIVKNNVVAYSANVDAFWPDGRKMLIDKSQRQRAFDFLFEPAGPGCSYVLKVSEANSFKDFLTDDSDSLDDVGLHDWLIYAWYRACGLKWYIDPVPRVLYRQHGGNQIGANSGLRSFVTRLRLLRSGWYRSEVSKVAAAIKNCPISSKVPKSISEGGHLPWWFLIRHGNSIRRRSRDRFFLLLLIVVKIY
jgi:rhamnosyltransferase